MSRNKNSGNQLVRVSLYACLLLAMQCVIMATPANKKSPAAPMPASLLLAEDGKPAMAIVVSASASAATKSVANELAGYLQLITGAPFDVVSGDGKTGIVLGTLREFPNPPLNNALAMHGVFDGKEAYVIRTEPKRLLLIGNADTGVSHAAFRFLETLGCRWFFPSKAWEVVPSKKTLRLSLDEADRPRILSRRIWYGYGIWADAHYDEGGKQSKDIPSSIDYYAWGRHNRMSSSLETIVGHTFPLIISQNSEIFAAHPEFLAEVGGKRQTKANNPVFPDVQLCLSNPELRKLIVSWAQNYLTANPEKDMVPLEAADGGGQCECEACKKAGSVSERMFALANEVARAIAKTHPGKMVGMMAYNDHCDPPSFALEPNVHIQLTHGFNHSAVPYEELMELWSRKCQSLGFYDYLSVWYWNWDMLPGGLGANIPYLRQQIPDYAAHHAQAVSFESGNNWGLNGRGYYIANKLMWNPQANVDQLLKDFYDKAFGPAAPAMQRYYERFDPGNSPLVTEDLVARGFRDLEEAGRLAVGRDDVQARLDEIKNYMRYVHLKWMIDRESVGSSRRKELTLELFSMLYRTRFSYMNHWAAIRHWWTPRAAEEFKEPTWNAHEATPNKAWWVKEPYTHADTEKAFQEGLAFFKPQDLDEKKFSRDLVPVKWEESPSIASSQRWLFGIPYAFYSRRGEPIEMILRNGTIYHDQPPALYTLKDSKGTVIAKGLMPLDDKDVPLSLKVPRAGLYIFEFASSAGWQIKVAADRVCTLLIPKGQILHNLELFPSLYFYVPKGTKEIQYYSDSTPHDVYSPDGKVIAPVGVQLQPNKSIGAILRIPVPANTDGKVWHLNKLNIGYLWFYNVPNYLAASPGALLVPHEVAVKDGLSISHE